jgi:hypothetical protein
MRIGRAIECRVTGVVSRVSEQLLELAETGVELSGQRRPA